MGTNQFDVGAVVALRSGGPEMWVESHEGDDVMCAWLDGAEVRRHAFHPATLTRCVGLPLGLNLQPPPAPAACSVPRTGVITGCAGSLAARDRRFASMFIDDREVGAIRCRFCGADVTAVMSREQWAREFAALPPQPSTAADVRH